MSVQIKKVNSNFSISYIDELKPRRFFDNTIQEYQIGCYLQKLSKQTKHLTLHCEHEQTKGDFSLDDDGFELKDNGGSLSSGYLSFEMIHTRNLIPSGILESRKNGVKYFLMYLQLGQYKKSKYKKHYNKLLLFETEPLYEWLVSNEYIVAENNKYSNSNALCYKVPLWYLDENISFKNLIKGTWNVCPGELEKFGKPEGIKNYFVQKMDDFLL